MSWPRFSGPDLGQDLCSINFHECIGAASSANEAFKLIAFQKPVFCGDCSMSSPTSLIRGISFIPFALLQLSLPCARRAACLDSLHFFHLGNASLSHHHTHLFGTNYCISTFGTDQTIQTTRMMTIRVRRSHLSRISLL
jgi:hypothetical protein